MRLILAILVGKLIHFLTRFFKLGGGSAAPGLYTLKIDPDLVSKLSQKIPKNIIITGTNGKTTTARLLSDFAKKTGLNVIRNHTGSNLERGIASTLINGVKLSHPWGDISRQLGIWELDEAAFNTVAPKIKPDIVVFLNVFRDQLDRYGEMDSVVKSWCETLTALPAQTTILVNGDDANTAKLAKEFKGKVLSFGVENYKIVGESVEKKALHTSSPRKRGSINKQILDFEAKGVKLNGLNGSTFQLTMSDERLTINLPLPGIYHIYDALAAIACASHLNLPTNRLSDHLINFRPAFGRVEKLPFGCIFLIKNPAGATQVFETIAPNIKPQDRLLLALNDNLADGTDVSWIWDVDFELLCHPELVSGSKTKMPLSKGHSLQLVRHNIICSGTRAYDLAIRLKYAGFDTNSILIEPNLKKALQEAKAGLNGQLYILPTYTAMLELQSILANSGIKKHYWLEEG